MFYDYNIEDVVALKADMSASQMPWTNLTEKIS